jgi:hypothetical protein
MLMNDAWTRSDSIRGAGDCSAWNVTAVSILFITSRIGFRRLDVG